jgi:protein-tyrosine phosphatase
MRGPSLRPSPERGCQDGCVGWIELEGAVNVRDLGGLPTEDGGKTAAGRLLRADNLQDLTPADVSKLVDDIGVTTVVDLRSSTELTAEGPAPLDSVPGVRHVHHPVLAEIGKATDVVADALMTRADRDRSRYPDDPACGHYLGYLEDRPDQVVAALRSIAHAGGAAIVHCAAGKDRTGIVVALALTAADVRPDAVIADFAATGERVEEILARLRASATYARDLDGSPTERHLPRPETMAAFLDQVDKRYGGVPRWLAEHGFGDDDVTLLRGKIRGT